MKSLKLGLLALACSAICGCASNKEAVIPNVTGDGNRIVVTLQPKHPWAGRPELRYARLLGTYDDGKDEAPEELANVREFSGTMLEFRMPDQLKAAPKGEICLQVEFRSGTLLPVRLKGDPGSDTTGFRFPAWEQAITARMTVQEQQNLLRQAARDIERLRAEIAALQRKMTLDFKGTTEDSCRKTQSAFRSTQVRPEQVISPDRQESAAVQECAFRIYSAANAWNRRLHAARSADSNQDKLQQLFGNSASDEFQAIDQVWALPDLVRELLQAKSSLKKELNEQFILSRWRQIESFQAEWTRLAEPRQGEPFLATYRPILPASLSSYIPLVPEASKAQLSWIARLYLPRVGATLPKDIQIQEASLRSFQGWIGANLDAFGECTQDIKRQLEVAWQVDQRSQDSGVEIRTQALQQSCRSDLKKIETLQADLARLLASQKQEQDPTPGQRNVSTTSGATRLNELRCH